LSDIERKRGLAHAGASGNNNQVGILQTGCHVVNFFKSGGYAGNELLAGEKVFNRLETFPDDVFDGIKRGPDFVFGNFKDAVLGLIQYLIDIRACFITAVDNFGG